MSMPRRFLISLALILAFAAAVSGQGLIVESYRGKPAAAGEIIVRFRSSDAATSRRIGARMAESDPDISSVEVIGSAGAVKLRSRKRTVEALVEAYRSRADVLYAEPNYLWRAADIPNDVYFDRQWSLRNTGQLFGSSSSTIGADMKVEAAWSLTEGDRSIVIGVIDTGVAHAHPDLAANMWSAPADFTVTIDGQTITCPRGSHGFNAIARNCNPDDDESHGTHLAGVIGAVGNNGMGISGINRVSSIMGLKFLNSQGTGTTADAVAAIEFAIQAKAIFGAAANVRVLNASWSGTTFSQALLDEINLANNRDMLFVTAAGNDGLDIEGVSEYPASYGTPNLITVAATARTDTLASFSNFGLTKVHLGAPGVEVYSTKATVTFGLESGTSSATAMVSGAAALVLAGCPALNTAALKTNLLAPASLDSLPALSGKTVTGGRVNVLKALNNCGATAPSTFFVTVDQRLKAVGVSGGRVTSTVRLATQMGFSAPVLLSIDAPAGITASLDASILTPGSPSAALTVDAVAGLPPGNYLIHITGTSGSLSKKTALMLTVLPELTVDVTLAGTLSATTSQRDATYLPRNDWAPFDGDRFADFYRIVVAEPKQFALTITSQDFTPKLYVRNWADGSLRGESSGSSFQSLTLTLQPGEYFIEATSSLSDRTGGYLMGLTIRPPPPTLTSVSPFAAARATPTPVTLTGTNFYSPLSPSGPSGGFTFSDVVVINSTTATATLTIGANVTPSTLVSSHSVNVTTPSGQSSAINFLVLEFPYGPPVITSVDVSTLNQARNTIVTFLGGAFLMPVVFNVEGTGITVSNITTPRLNSVIATFNVAADAPLGERRVTISSAVVPGLQSAPVIFTVLPRLPTLSSVTPATALKGTDINVTLTGTFFDSTLRLVYGTSQSGTVIPDPGVVVDNINVISSTTATATVHVSAAAFFGSHAAMVTTLGGSVVRLNSLNVIPVVPVLTGISPAVGEQGTSVNVTMTGSFPGPGVGVNAVSGIGVTNIAAGEEVLTATFNISSSATLGLRDVVVSNNGGSSQPVSFLVIRRVPTVFSLSPNAGLVGSSVNVTLNGAGFIPGGTSLTVSGAPGVTVSNVNASSSSLMTVTLTIAPNAEIGPRNLTITNAGGTTDVVFTVALPFPDLRPSSSHTGNFVVGFQETYTVLVQNVGTAATTGAITLTDTLPASISFVSGTGNGWSCVAAAQIVQCLNAGPLNVGASSTIAMVVRQTSAGTVTHTVTVASPGDHNSSNDSATESITAVTAPLPTLLLPLSVTPGQQSTVDLRLQNPFFRDLTGILTLTFTPGGPNPINDPAIQFVTGGRQVAFTIPANTLQARFGANPVASPVGFQTGSVAGTFQFGATLDSGQALPSSSTLTILNQAPAIVGAVSDTQNGFALVVTLLAPGRQVDSIEMVFITGANVQFGCGSVPGCTAGPATITLDLKSLFENWFSVDRALGSMSQLRVPLAISGVVTGRVIVRMRNSLGASNGVQVFLP